MLLTASAGIMAGDRQVFDIRVKSGAGHVVVRIFGTNGQQLTDLLEQIQTM